MTEPAIDRPAPVLGVLIDIPDPYCATLLRWRERIGDPMAQRIDPHITLLPPTQVPAGLDEVIAHLERASATCQPFPVHLSGTGTFRPVSDVVFVQVARGISECELLAAAVRSGPLARELSFPYHPHVTVAQDVAVERLDEAYEGLRDFTGEFKVETFTLYLQDETEHWEPMRSFPLGTSP